MQKGKKKILAVVEDLFFTAKIGESAKRTGIEVEFLKSETDVLERAKQKPLLVILDLNIASVPTLALVTKLKASAETKSISCIGYLSHLQGELKQKAIEAGCDMVLARSAFSQNLSQILKRHAGIY